MKALALLAAGLVGNGGIAAGALVSVYEFNGNFDDSLGNGSAGGDGPLLVASTGSESFAGGQWAWTSTTSPGTGLLLDVSPALAGNYTVGIRFKFADVTSFRKIIDFLNGSSDNGLYIYNGALTFYPTTNTGSTSIAANTFVDLLLTRSTDNAVAGYINGNPVGEWKFTDSTSLAVAGPVGNAARFRIFQDDKITTSEWSNGTVDEIRLWDEPLTAAEIPNAFAPVPEPATLAFCAAAFAVTSLLRRRNQCPQPASRRGLLRSAEP
jgi:Concanavalin A-like lectin/glucanases superfamily